MTTEKVSLKHWLETRWRGTLMAVIIGAASLFVSEHYGGPAVLFALLIGMAFHFLSEDRRTLAGIHFCSTTVLRWGVGLLGAKIHREPAGTPVSGPACHDYRRCVCHTTLRRFHYPFFLSGRLPKAHWLPPLPLFAVRLPLLP